MLKVSRKRVVRLEHVGHSDAYSHVAKAGESFPHEGISSQRLLKTRYSLLLVVICSVESAQETAKGGGIGIRHPGKRRVFPQVVRL